MVSMTKAITRIMRTRGKPSASTIYHRLKWKALKPYRMSWWRGDFRLRDSGLTIEPVPGRAIQVPITNALTGEQTTHTHYMPQGEKEYDPFEYYWPPGRRDHRNSVHRRLAALARGDDFDLPALADDFLRFANDFGLPTAPRPAPYPLQRFRREAKSLRNVMRLGEAVANPPSGRKKTRELASLLESLDGALVRAMEKAGLTMHRASWETHLREHGRLRERTEFAFFGLMQGALRDTWPVVRLQPPRADEAADLTSDTLLAACFAMYHMDLKRGLGTRACQNERCPVGYFVPAQVNQWHCSPRCRLAKAQREYRKRQARP